MKGKQNKNPPENLPTNPKRATLGYLGQVREFQIKTFRNSLLKW